MLDLPSNAEPYRTIGPFDQGSLPRGLLREHSTKAGVWGFLQVESGSVRYIITETSDAGSHLLTPECPGVIAPEHKHHLELIGDVRLRITFHQAT